MKHSNLSLFEIDSAILSAWCANGYGICIKDQKTSTSDAYAPGDVFVTYPGEDVSLMGIIVAVTYMGDVAVLTCLTVP